MNFNSNIIGTIVIALSMGLIGAFMNGERINRKMDREKIKHIERIQEDTKMRIDSIYAYSVDRERQLLLRIDSMYQLLDHIYEQKVITERQYAQYKTNIVNQRKEINKQWQQVGRPFVYKTK